VPISDAASVERARRIVGTQLHLSVYLSSELRSSIGQRDPEIGQLEGFEGSLVRLALAPHRHAQAFEAFELAPRESKPIIAKSSPIERGVGPTLLVTRVATEHMPMLDKGGWGTRHSRQYSIAHVVVVSRATASGELLERMASSWSADHAA